MTNSLWEVSGATVVIVAQSHNPSIINPDFLKDNGIVDRDWKLVPVPIITTPVVAQISYKDAAWHVMPDKCIISGKIGINDMNNDDIYKCAERYIEVLRHVPYKAIGLNWQVTRKFHSDANRWLHSKFLKAGVWDDDVVLVEFVVRLRLENHAICSLTVKAPIPQEPIHIGMSQVIIDCNFHFDIQDEEQKVEKMKGVLKNWLNYKTIMNEYLEQYFKEEGAR